MKTKHTSILLFLFLLTGVQKMMAKDTTYVEKGFVLETPTGKLYGTLLTPVRQGKMPLVFIISGSGPTDRDGNSTMIKGKNESLHKLATGLSERGIASFRYDKRGIGESKAAMVNESKLCFDDFVTDAKAWLELLKKDPRFSSITVVGHSEGSLIGMIAARGMADKYISIAGAGAPADEILKTQFKNLPDKSRQEVYAMLDTLKGGDTLKKVDPSFYMLFRPSVQPYLICWFKHDPSKEIKQLHVPVLIIQGTNDIQITVEDARRLSSALPEGKLELIEKMNHILRIIDSGDRKENIDSYSKSEPPLAPELLKSIGDFVLNK